MDFAATLDLVQEMSFSRLHVFRYSPRPGTAAAEFGGQVPPAVKRERSTSLGRLGAQLALAYHQRYLSQRVEVLAEQRGEDGAFHGLTRDYVRVHFPGEEQLTNRLLWVQVKEARAEGLWGQLQ